MNFLGNGYSPNMCLNPNMNIEQRELTLKEFKKESKNALSCIGHPSFATRLTQELGHEIPCIRRNISLQPGNTFYYACINGKRLQKGEYRIPNAEIRYFRMKFKEMI